MNFVTEATEQLPTGPAPDAVDLAFWQGLSEDRLLLPRCPACGTWRVPGRPLCAACHTFGADWQAVAPHGTVYTWIRSHRAFVSELDVAVPYVTVLVKLDEAPVRLLGILEDAAVAAIGMPVHGVIRRPTHAEWPVLRWATGGAR